jgi:hypothetical protein
MPKRGGGQTVKNRIGSVINGMANSMLVGVDVSQDPVIEAKKLEILQCGGTCAYCMVAPVPTVW